MHQQTFDFGHGILERPKRHSPEYTQLLRDPRWQELRNMVLSRESYVCEFCGAEEATQVHHGSYRYLEVELKTLKTDHLSALCGGCHQKAHTPGYGPVWEETKIAVTHWADTRIGPRWKQHFTLWEVLDMMERTPARGYPS